MRGWRGILAGALVLAALEVTVSSPSSAGRAGGILTTIGDLARRFLSPGVAAFSKAAPAPNTTGNALSPLPGPGNGAVPLPNLSPTPSGPGTPPSLSPGVPLPASYTYPYGSLLPPVSA